MNTTYLRIEAPYNRELLLTQIRQLEDNQDILQLEVTEEVDREIIWAASYNANNTLILKANVFKPLTWLIYTASLAKRCGLYTILEFYPITPKNTRVVQILQILEGIVPAHLEVRARFAKFKSIPSSIPKDTLVYVNGQYRCSNSFKLLFIETLQYYLSPYNIVVYEAD